MARLGLHQPVLYAQSRPSLSMRFYVFFVHRGSTSTSNLLQLYGDALGLIEHHAKADCCRLTPKEINEMLPLFMVANAVVFHK